MCSLPMAQILRRYGYPGDMPMDTAKNLIDALASNQWRALDRNVSDHIMRMETP